MTIEPAVAGREAVRRVRIATRVGMAVWMGFVLVLAAGADHPLPAGFWIAPAAGLILFPAARWTFPRLLDLWGSGRQPAALGGAAASGAGCGALVWTLMAAGHGNLATAATSATATGYAVVMAVGALAWPAMLVLARWLDTRTA